MNYLSEITDSRNELRYILLRVTFASIDQWGEQQLVGILLRDTEAIQQQVQRELDARRSCELPCR